MQGPAGFWPERPLVTAEFSSPLESQLWLQKGPLTLLTAVWAPRVLTTVYIPVDASGEPAGLGEASPGSGNRGGTLAGGLWAGLAERASGEGT